MNSRDALIEVIRKGYENEYPEVNDFLIDLLDAFEEYERTKPMELPVERFINDWVEWLTVDMGGRGVFHEKEPLHLLDHHKWASGCRRVVAGYFMRQDDWKADRWHLEDGKWVRK